MPYDVPNSVTLGFDIEAMSSFASSSTVGYGGGAVDDGVGKFKVNHEGNKSRSISRFMQQQQRSRQKKLHETRSTVDGLSDGILNQTLYYSLLTKSLYPWTDAIPRSIYLEYVVSFAIVNEPRTDYRPLLFETLREALKGWERPVVNNQLRRNQLEEWPHARTRIQTSSQALIKEVVKLVNTRLWSLLGRSSPTSSPTQSKPIVFRPGLTPRIYDPLSVISYGYSSCTGLAVLLIAALRSVGIPARLVGTPAWYGKEENGNHSWLEVFVPNEPAITNTENNLGGDESPNNPGGKWIFLEPTPGIAEGEEESADADDLDRDPCKRWFCKADRFDGSTHVFASRYTKVRVTGASVGNGPLNDLLDAPLPSSTYYQMAWALGDKGVPGEDRTEYYTSVCGKCNET